MAMKREKRVYFYLYNNIFQNYLMRRRITLYTMVCEYIRTIINEPSLIVDTYLSFTN
jgi:hypothetical protein